ncbi:MAG: transposase [Thiothrix sp.]|nr:transposase [Thiothrix sp.]
MNTTQRDHLSQRWNFIQAELLPELKSDGYLLTPKLERLIHILEWVRIDEFVVGYRSDTGRPQHERAWFANAFVAKAVLQLSTTKALIERLTIDRSLRRICGFSMHKKLPSESTFSRAFSEFAVQNLAERVHDTLVKTHLGDRIIGHISRDGTAIEARERPKKSTADDEDKQSAKKRGRPRRGESREKKPTSRIKHQQTQTLDEMLADLPTACDRGAKSNAKGYKSSWNGYKLHIDTACCGVPISALISSASMHDSGAAIPLSLMSAQKVTNLYDVMDAGYCSIDLHEYSRSLGHIPLIDHNPRGGIKEEFEPLDAQRYNERSVAERINARLKDEFGGRNIMVRGSVKVMSHLMFGILALSADQLMRLLL